MEPLRLAVMRRSTLFVGAMLAGVLATPLGAMAQTIADLRASETPLVLKAQGSFFVGGVKVEQTEVELGSLGPRGHITINQMYVRYMVPQGGDDRVPVVMIHGATLTGKSWETTPDGRMGWDEYFVRNGHPVYVPDQVGRGRSGFNQAVYNNARAGSTPPASQPAWLRFSDEGIWPNFRFGSKAGAPYPDSQFPVAAVDELSKQGVPDLNYGLPQPNPTIKALSELASQLKGAVLMGHSQSGSFPLEAALLNPTAAKGLVLLEPGRCPDTYTEQQVKTLATVPILVVFGDHRDTPTGLPTLPTWQARFEACEAMITRIKSAGGRAEMLAPPDRGIRGNSHMVMQDKNSLQIADLILQWIGAHTASASADAQPLSITRGGSRPIRPAPAQNFTGGARVEMLFEPRDGSHASGGSVTFEPGARTAWHSHPGGQILIITAGIGRVQRWGDPIVEVRAGDVVRIPPGEKHWHGASPHASMTHVAISEPRNGASVHWMEKVSDEQYNRALSGPEEPAAQVPVQPQVRSGQQPPPSTRPQATGRPSGERQQRIAPGLAALTDDVLYGDVWRRPELSPRDRSLVTISVLIATGKPAQLAGHLGRALESGVQPSEASGVLAQLAVYCGWPNAVTALEVYDQVYTARKVDTAALRAAGPRLPAPVPDAGRAKALGQELEAVAPKFVQLTNDIVFGDLWRRSDLTPRDRSLVTIAALAATGADDQLDFYLRRGLDSGLTPGEIAEAVTHLGFYAGWARATSAMSAVVRSLGK